MGINLRWYLTLPTFSDILSYKNLFYVCKFTCKLVQMLEKKSLFSVGFIQPHSSFHAVGGSLLLQHHFSCLSFLTGLSNSTDSSSPGISFISSSSVTPMFSFSLPTFFNKEISSIAMPSAVLFTVPWEFFFFPRTWHGWPLWVIFFKYYLLNDSTLSSQLAIIVFSHT